MKKTKTLKEAVTMTKATRRLLDALASASAPVAMHEFQTFGYSKRPQRSINAMIAAKLVRDTAAGYELTATGRKAQAAAAASTAAASWSSIG